MARKPRVEGPGAVYWVTGQCVKGTRLRGSDRDLFLEILRRAVGRHHWGCHAYALQADGYQLAIETPQANLSRGMRDLIGEFTQTFNRRNGRSGSVFAGRYKSAVVEKGVPLLEVCRAVALAPVADGLCKKPGKWPWCSFGPTAGREAAPGLLTTDWLLGQFGNKPKKAQARYEKFVKLGLGLAPPEIHHATYVGSEKFGKQLLRGAAPATNKPAKKISRPALKALFPAEVLKDRARRDARVHEARATHGYTLSSIAVAAGLHSATVSRIARAKEEEVGWKRGGEAGKGEKGVAKKPTKG